MMSEIVADRRAHGRQARARPRARCGLPILTLDPAKPCSFARHRILDQRLRFDMQPAAFGGIERDRRSSRRPPCCHSGRPARLQRRSHSAVSMAASASEVIAPTAVAWVANRRSRQIASISSASRPISARHQGVAQQADDRTGRRCRWYSCSPRPTAPSASVMVTKGVSWLTKLWIASVRLTFGTRSTMPDLDMGDPCHVRPPSATCRWRHRTDAPGPARGGSVSTSPGATMRGP